MAVSADVRRVVAARDGNRCAYCRTSEENCGLAMHLDHIVPEVAGGEDEEENLCLACFSCNVNKGAQQRALDPETGEDVPLFHPVRQRWAEHFGWSQAGTRIFGKTPVGRATVSGLEVCCVTAFRPSRSGRLAACRSHASTSTRVRSRRGPAVCCASPTKTRRSRGRAKPSADRSCGQTPSCGRTLRRG